jgi:hypothetical protein
LRAKTYRSFTATNIKSTIRIRKTKQAIRRRLQRRQTLHLEPRPAAMRVAMVRGAPEPAQIVFQVSARPTATDPEPGLAPGNSVEAKVKGPYRRYTVHYNVAVDNLACSTTPDGIHHCSLQILALVYDSYGGLVNTQANGVKLAIPAARYDAVLSHGIEFKQEICKMSLFAWESSM